MSGPRRPPANEPFGRKAVELSLVNGTKPLTIRPAIKCFIWRVVIAQEKLQYARVGSCAGSNGALAAALVGHEDSIDVAACPTWSTWRSKRRQRGSRSRRKAAYDHANHRKCSGFNRLARVFFASVKQNLLLPFNNLQIQRCQVGGPNGQR
jgi:hypothetical protein